MKKEQRNLLILILIVVLIISFVIFTVIKKKQIDKKVSIIQGAINNQVGAHGEDIDSILLSVTPSTSPVPTSLTESIYSAKGSAWYKMDDPDKIIKALSGKTKSYIKAISIAFQNRYGIKLDEFVRDVHDDITGFNEQGYNQVLNIVKSAK